jgi:hypothetical protein
MRARTVVTVVIVAPGAIVLGTLATFLATGLLITSAGRTHAGAAADARRHVHRSHLAHPGRRRSGR